MSDMPPPPNLPPPGPNGAGGEQPPLIGLAQYVKDLSFEVPNAPEIFEGMTEQPRVDFSIDLSARPLRPDGNVFELTLRLRCDAKTGETTAYIAELSYCGIFALNLPEEMIQPVLFIECPALLFPFARRVLADAVRDGGFASVMLPPMDFNALWRSRAAQEGTPAGTMLA